MTGLPEGDGIQRTEAGNSSLEDVRAKVAAVSHDHASVAVDGDAVITAAELPVASALAADGAHVRAVTIENNLHSMVAPVGNNKVALAVKRDAATACSELSVAAASAADGAHVGAVAQSKHLPARSAAFMLVHLPLPNKLPLPIKLPEKLPLLRWLQESSCCTERCQESCRSSCCCQ